MSAMSDYLEGKIAQFMFKNNVETFASPGNALYVAVFTAATGLETNSPSAEVLTAGGTLYARVQVLAANWTQTGGAVENTNDIEFPIAGVAWGTITHVAIMDGETAGAGNVYYWGELTMTRTVGAGDQLKFAAGDLNLTHD